MKKNFLLSLLIIFYCNSYAESSKQCAKKSNIPCDFHLKFKKNTYYYNIKCPDHKTYAEARYKLNTCNCNVIEVRDTLQMQGFCNP